MTEREEEFLSISILVVNWREGDRNNALNDFQR